ncbi:hypothetical protein HPB52_015702 [Rhipicephalus sanguineus]|uniref:Transmembrane protein n=1 Tax=Rhipicephalus sanguineus TaxID=34632 RepID=A0A9D4Q1R4_RHISA|nr:hypothetical protein HPB52_015702 [Rhipicephalus sanguineus]
MYAQRDVLSLPLYSLSAPSLGSRSPAPATRTWCTNTPLDSLGVQHSESSSPTTSLLLQMWGHVPCSSGRAVELHPDLVADEAGAPKWLRVITDLHFLRRTTVIVCGLAVLTCFVAVLLTAANQLRTHEWVDEHAWDNWTEPVLSLVEDHWSMSNPTATLLLLLCLVIVDLATAPPTEHALTTQAAKKESSPMADYEPHHAQKQKRVVAFAAGVASDSGTNASSHDATPALSVPAVPESSKAVLSGDSDSVDAGAAEVGNGEWRGADILRRFLRFVHHNQPTTMFPTCVLDLCSQDAPITFSAFLPSP